MGSVYNRIWCINGGMGMNYYFSYFSVKGPCREICEKNKNTNFCTRNEPLWYKTFVLLVLKSLYGVWYQKNWS